MMRSNIRHLVIEKDADFLPASEGSLLEGSSFPPLIRDYISHLMSS
jgi:hypothetical protein